MSEARCDVWAMDVAGQRRCLVQDARPRRLIPYEPDMSRRAGSLPPPGPSNLIYPSPYVGPVGFWFFVSFCIVMLALLGGTALGWWGR